MSCNYSQTDLKIENEESANIESTQLEIEKEIISVIDRFTEAINTKNPDIVSDILDSELDKIKFYIKSDSSYHKKSSSSLDFLKTHMSTAGDSGLLSVSVSDELVILSKSINN